MTREQDIERVLDRWLTEGPTQMPSRFLNDTLERIDLVPPRRLVGLRTTWPAIHPYLRFAAAAAVFVAVAGIGAVVLTRTGGIGGSSPRGSGFLPPSLQAEWRPVGTRDLPERSGPFAQSLDIIVASTQVTIFDYHVDVLNAAKVVGPDRIELRALNKGMYWHCQVGDVGTYTFRLSGGTHLTLTPVADACAERATILAGDWTRTDIGNPVPGRRVSAIFKPLGGGKSGHFAYTVPAGWSLGSEGDERETRLTMSKTGTAVGPTISVFSSVALADQPAACAGAGPVAGATSPSIAQWLTTFRDVVVTAPSEVTIGGMRGVFVDLSVRPGWTNQCKEGRSVFGNDATGDAVLAVAGERRARYYLLDAGEGRTLLVDVEAPGSSTWDADVAAMTSIVQSFEFTP